ncbi:Metallo-dependent phosphatase-like protein [Thamnidium elegans]|nr:Metallo-dependent phosphatase-like protein [Thamnidium elegans]
MSTYEMTDEDTNENTFKILIATDNHIGYLETDPVRGQDSFLAFEEILKIAKLQQVDFILLGGDLFHANRPSRSCLHRTMRMLRNYCFGERESKVWIASDQSENFGDIAQANYLDENLNISMPVFSIHGNHDDPSGVGNLSALNLLSVAGMVNYFGNSTSIQDVTIQPILMKKGSSKLALYGLGNIREERLHRQWRSGHVKFTRPEDDGTPDSWRNCFNMFVFHQNRARHGPTNHIPEEFLDEFLDLVVWGHEHECRIHPEQYEDFSITQPGSSVATSLCQGEAAPKHVGILTIEGGNYDLEKIRLKTIRPLQFTTVILSRIESIEPSDKNSIRVYLEGVVESLIEKAKNEWDEQQEQGSGIEPSLDMPMPLIRIRVDYSDGYETFNPLRFGQRFIKRVANPNDMLKFQKTRSKPITSMTATELLNDLSTAVPERLDRLKVEDLVHELLKKDLFILPEEQLKEAVKTAVEKGDKTSIHRFMDAVLLRTRDSITTLPDDIEDLTLDFIKRKSNEAKQNTSASYPSVIGDDAVQPTPIQRGNTNSDNNNNTLEISDSDSEEYTPSPTITLTTARRGRGRGSSSSSNRGRGTGRGRGSDKRGASPTALDSTPLSQRRRVLPR